MDNTTTEVSEISEPSNLLTSEKWQRELQVSKKAMRKFWERGRRVVKRYMDEMETASVGLQTATNVSRYNVFWSNVGILKASLYANPPKPLVKREFDDYMDQTGRVASVMMERLLTQPFEKPESDMNLAFFKIVEDRLVPGLGQVWLRYEPTIEKTTYLAGEEVNGVSIHEDLEVEHIVDETVATDYVYWEDFLWSPCRTWEECRWVARRAHMTKAEFTKRFGKKLASQVSWSRKGQTKELGERVTPEDYGISKTEVYEIWDKASKSVIWVAESCSYILDQQEDPLKIMGFFPCPKPLLATTTTSSTIPKADYLMVQSQYRRLDNLTTRIGLLEDAIQASGVYDKSNKELSQILSGNMNKMVPVDNWAMFAEKGGLKGVVDWFPLEMIVNALDKLRELKNDAKAELYELTGISDIMRGSTAPRETAMAQGLKAQYSSVRLQYLQGEVSYFIQDALRIKAEIIAHHFQPETIIRASLINLTPDADLAMQAVELLKNTWAKHYRIQVFSNDLAIPDYNAERAGRTEFIGAMGQYISQVVPLIEMEPATAPFLMQILQWGISSFRSAQSIEGVFQKALTEMQKSLQQPRPEKPDPKLLTAQANIARDNAKAQAAMALEAQKAQDAKQVEGAQLVADMTLQNSKSQAEITKAVTEAVTATINHRQDMAHKEEKHQQALIHKERKAENDRRKA
jgi:hypothetical protein